MTEPVCGRGPVVDLLLVDGTDARIQRNPKPIATEGAARRVWDFVESSPRARGNCDPEALACSAEQMWPEGYPLELAGPGIARARLPVLIVNGADDHPYVDSADALALALPGANHLRIPGTDHLSTVASERFKRAVLEFLADGDCRAI